MAHAIRSYRRIVLIFVLLVAQVGMLVHYGEYKGNCPDVECYATDYDSAIGETARVGGPVVETDPTIVAIQYASNKYLRLELTETTVSPESGTLVSMYGTFQPNNQFAVIEIIVKPPADRQYMFTVSGFGILIIFGLIIWHWSVDWQKLMIKNRGD